MRLALPALVAEVQHPAPAGEIVVPGVGLCRPLSATRRFALLADPLGRPIVIPVSSIERPFLPGGS